MRLAKAGETLPKGEEQFYTLKVGGSGKDSVNLRIIITKPIIEKMGLKKGSSLVGMFEYEDGDPVLVLKVLKNPFHKSRQKEP